MHIRPSVVHINDERATSTDLSIIDLDRIWDSLVSTSGSQPVLSVSSSEIISSMLWISTLHKLYEDRYIECMPHYTINIVGVNEPTLKGENTVREVCLSVSAFVNLLKLMLSLRWLLSKPDWSSLAIYSCRKLTRLHRFYSYQSWLRPSLYQKKSGIWKKLLNGISIQF